jgi:putrescine transport system substrate-binding protein
VQRAVGRPAQARRAALAAALAIAALGLGACGKGPSGAPGASVAPGAEEPVLNIYNWADYIGHDTIAEFERQEHIKVVSAFYDSNQTMEATLLAGRSGYDIVSTTTTFFGHQIKAGAYRPLDRSKLPNWKNLDPAVLAVQAQVDPGNRFGVPYLHAMNGFVYNADLVRARLPDAPTDSLALIFDPKVMARLKDCGVSFLDSPEDVLQLALAYLHRDPNSSRPEDLQAAEAVVKAVRPYIRTFDSQDYWHQLAANEICVAIAWSGDYTVAQTRAREDKTGAHLVFTFPKEGSNITYNAMLIPASAPHPEAAHKFLNFLLEGRVIAAISNDIHYGNDNLAAKSRVDPAVANDPAVYPPPELRARLYMPLDLGPEYDRLRTRAWTRIKTGQ